MSEIEELRQEVNELRDRVAELESESGGNSGGERALFDRYDSYVMDRVEDVHSAPPRRLMTLYEQSGIVDRNKRKRRAKRLKNITDSRE